MGGSMRALVLESVAMSVFAVVAVVGFKRNVWLVDDPGVPEWWPAFCMAADVGIAALLTSARQWLMVAARPR
jgi:hypothetical protein